MINPAKSRIITIMLLDKTGKLVISREIRPHISIIPTPLQKKVPYSYRRCRHDYAYGIFASFYCINVFKNMGGGRYNAAKGLISQGIAV